ncbi:MAG TPA: hypothetical protein VGE22_12510 [Solimonas sp.]
MRTIVLYGAMPVALDVYRHVDVLLRQRNERGIVLMVTSSRIEPVAAHAVREDGGELWYCGEVAGDGAAIADRQLLVLPFEDVAGKSANALEAFLSKTRVAA